MILINSDHLKTYYMEKIKVIYLGTIWISNTWINKETWENCITNYPHNKILISQNGTTLSVCLKSVKLYEENKKRKEKQ